VQVTRSSRPCAHRIPLQTIASHPPVSRTSPPLSPMHTSLDACLLSPEAAFQFALMHPSCVNSFTPPFACEPPMFLPEATCALSPFASPQWADVTLPFLTHSSTKHLPTNSAPLVSAVPPTVDAQPMSAAEAAGAGAPQPQARAKCTEQSVKATDSPGSRAPGTGPIGWRRAAGASRAAGSLVSHICIQRSQVSQVQVPPLALQEAANGAEFLQRGGQGQAPHAKCRADWPPNQKRSDRPVIATTWRDIESFASPEPILNAAPVAPPAGTTAHAVATDGASPPWQPQTTAANASPLFAACPMLQPPSTDVPPIAKSAPIRAEAFTTTAVSAETEANTDRTPARRGCQASGLSQALRFKRIIVERTRSSAALRPLCAAATGNMAADLRRPAGRVDTDMDIATSDNEGGGLAGEYRRTANPASCADESNLIPIAGASNSGASRIPAAAVPEVVEEAGHWDPRMAQRSAALSTHAAKPRGEVTPEFVRIVIERRVPVGPQKVHEPAGVAEARQGVDMTKYCQAGPSEVGSPAAAGDDGVVDLCSDSDDRDGNAVARGDLVAHMQRADRGFGGREWSCSAVRDGTCEQAGAGSGNKSGTGVEVRVGVMGSWGLGVLQAPCRGDIGEAIGAASGGPTTQVATCGADLLRSEARVATGVATSAQRGRHCGSRALPAAAAIRPLGHRRAGVHAPAQNRSQELGHLVADYRGQGSGGQSSNGDMGSEYTGEYANLP
jgi:hypothetical protein